MILTFLKTIVITLLLVFVTACSAINPVGKADTVEQKAYAAYGTYVIFAEKAADLVERPDLSTSVKLKLIEAEERASPIVKQLLGTTQEYAAIQAEVAAGTTSEERLLIVSGQLNNWVNRLLPLIDNLIRTVKGAD